MGKRNKFDSYIIIPNKIFKKLWILSSSYSDYKSFYNEVLKVKSNNYIDYKKYNIDLNSYSSFLNSLYIFSHYSFSDLLKLTGYSLTEFSDAFCIPIQTVKTWSSPKSTFSSYNLLFYLRYFNLIDFGKIKIEEEIKHFQISNKEQIRKSNEISKLLHYFDDSDKFDFFKKTNLLITNKTEKDIKKSESVIYEKSTNQENDSCENKIKFGPLHGKSIDESLAIFNKYSK